MEQAEKIEDRADTSFFGELINHNLGATGQVEP